MTDVHLETKQWKWLF